MTKVGVIGLWHLGSVTSACLSNFGYHVVGFDSDSSVIQNLNQARGPIFEPGLDELLKKNLKNKRLRFTTNMEEAITDADYVFLTIDTPVDEQDRVDLVSVHDMIQEIIRFITNNVTIIVQSQVPVGTCNEFIKIIKQKRPLIEFGLAYCPENLRLGRAIDTFEHPDRIIIGSDDEQTTNKVKSFFEIINCPKIIMNLKSAEMTKHCLNTFLAMCISFINSVGNVCEKLGVDVNKVSEGLMSEHRIGNRLPLRSGAGFAGGTLGRDVRILEELCKKIDVEPFLYSSILRINHEQNILVVKKLLKHYHSLDGIKISILGLTYKAGTNTLRRSASVEIIKELLKLNSRVKAYDPSISSMDLIQDKNFQLCTSPYTAAEETSALLIFTDWPQFRELDYKRIFSSMKNPLIFDIKNFLDENHLKTLGFLYSR